MKNKVVFILLLVIASITSMLFAGCNIAEHNSEPKSVYKSNSVEIVQNGNKTAVYDILNDKTYNFGVKRVKRLDGDFKAYTTVDTDTLKIDIIPRGLKVYDKAEGKIFTMERRIR